MISDLVRLLLEQLDERGIRAYGYGHSDGTVLLSLSGSPDKVGAFLQTLLYPAISVNRDAVGGTD